PRRRSRTSILRLPLSGAPWCVAYYSGRVRSRAPRLREAQMRAACLVLAVVAAAGALSLAGISAFADGGPSRPLAPVTKRSHCRLRVHGVLPDSRCTPGAIFTRATRRVVCRRGYSRRVRNVPQNLKDRVYRAYGVRHHRPYQYEIDHLVSLE